MPILRALTSNNNSNSNKVIQSDDMHLNRYAEFNSNSNNYGPDINDEDDELINYDEYSGYKIQTVDLLDYEKMIQNGDILDDSDNLHPNPNYSSIYSNNHNVNNSNYSDLDSYSNCENEFGVEVENVDDELDEIDEEEEEDNLDFLNIINDIRYTIANNNSHNDLENSLLQSNTNSNSIAKLIANSMMGTINANNNNNGRNLVNSQLINSSNLSVSIVDHQKQTNQSQLSLSSNLNNKSNEQVVQIKEDDLIDRREPLREIFKNEIFDKYECRCDASQGSLITKNVKLTKSMQRKLANLYMILFVQSINAQNHDSFFNSGNTLDNILNSLNNATNSSTNTINSSAAIDSIVENSIQNSDYKKKLFRSMRSIVERISIDALTICDQYHNQLQQNEMLSSGSGLMGLNNGPNSINLSTNLSNPTTKLWCEIRNRGCQFLGPQMQDDVLRLILHALETVTRMSRKVLVLYVVHMLKKHYPKASKTSVGHVVQLLYRAGCFKVEKRENDSSLMELKKEYSKYTALRRQHDTQIIQIALEAGIRMSPEQWSQKLFGDSSHKSDMQSIIDKLQSQQTIEKLTFDFYEKLASTHNRANSNESSLTSIFLQVKDDFDYFASINFEKKQGQTSPQPQSESGSKRNSSLGGLISKQSDSMGNLNNLGSGGESLASEDDEIYDANNCLIANDEDFENGSIIDEIKSSRKGSLMNNDKKNVKQAIQEQAKIEWSLLIECLERTVKILNAYFEYSSKMSNLIMINNNYLNSNSNNQSGNQTGVGIIGVSNSNNINNKLKQVNQGQLSIKPPIVNMRQINVNNNNNNNNNKNQGMLQVNQQIGNDLMQQSILMKHNFNDQKLQSFAQQSLSPSLSNQETNMINAKKNFVQDAFNKMNSNTNQGISNNMNSQSNLLATVINPNKYIKTFSSPLVSMGPNIQMNPNMAQNQLNKNNNNFQQNRANFKNNLMSNNNNNPSPNPNYQQPINKPNKPQFISNNNNNNNMSDLNNNNSNCGNQFMPQSSNYPNKFNNNTINNNNNNNNNNINNINNISNSFLTFQKTSSPSQFLNSNNSNNNNNTNGFNQLQQLMDNNYFYNQNNNIYNLSANNVKKSNNFKAEQLVAPFQNGLSEVSNPMTTVNKNQKFNGSFYQSQNQNQNQQHASNNAHLINQQHQMEPNNFNKLNHSFQFQQNNNNFGLNNKQFIRQSNLNHPNQMFSQNQLMDDF